MLNMNEATPINHDEIALLAYRHWEQDGRPQGCDRQYWLEAEQQLKATKHLLLAEQNAARVAARPVNGNGKPSASGNGQAAAMKSKARQTNPAVPRRW